MATPATILIFGQDARLLETRCMVLRRAGYTVTTATSLAEIGHVVSAGPVDVLILCYSLSLEECGRALALAHSGWPLLKSLVLTAGEVGCRTTNLLDRVLDAMEGPAKLVSTVHQLVGSQDAAVTHIC